MKKIMLLILVVLNSGLAFADEPEKDIVPFFSYATFYSPEQGPYIETYLTILGHSLYFQPENEGQWSATIESTILIKKGGEIIDFKKVNLKSPLVQDTTKINFSLVDVQRFAVPTGMYEIEVKLVDINSPFDPMYFLDSVSVDFNSEDVSVSGLQLIERYKKSEETNIRTKGGYELYSLPLNFFPKSVNELIFYFETYNTNTILGQDEQFLIKAYIEQFETRIIAADMVTFKRDKSRPVVGFMHAFDISKLASGNYFLVVEVRDKSNELMAQNKLFFQRSNPAADNVELYTEMAYKSSFVTAYTNKDTLADYIKSLRPISTENEKAFIDQHMKMADIDRMQQFLYAFWATRSQTPQDAWLAYALEVKKVNNSFGTSIRKGYETDRGRVYLQYGSPNTIATQANEPSTYPYEIWHYYQLDNQRNRKFVFYNRDLVTNDYELLHSDAMGEVQDYQWQVKLNQRNYATNDPDIQKSDWGWGSKVDDFWNNPR